MQSIRLYHSAKAADTSNWKRPRSKASHPPGRMPAMTSNTLQARGARYTVIFGDGSKQSVEDEKGCDALKSATINGQNYQRLRRLL